MSFQSSQKSRLQKLYYHLDSILPAEFQVGEGNLLYLWGYCFSSDEPLQNLEIVLDNQTFGLHRWGFPRWDVQTLLFPQLKANNYKIIQSGFFTSIEIHKVNHPGPQNLILQATFADGEKVQMTLGNLELVKLKNLAAPALTEFPILSDQPVVAVCMATYNPPLDLFKKQIASIRAQTYKNWICLVSDDCSDEYFQLKIRETISGDERFQFFPSADRLGFYHNFERVLSLVPVEVQYVALCDQDDDWYPEKIEVLLSRFDPQTTLVFSDMNIVTANGGLIQSTYWKLRPNRFDSLTSLILANTITGAASLFRRDLLDFALPFPQEIAASYHDHWIGCLALAMGDVKYVNRSLYDYVQHRDNVLGWFKGDNSIVMDLKAWLSIFTNPENRASFLNQSKQIYLNDYFRIQNIAGVILLRTRGRITETKRKDVESIFNADKSIWTQLWLFARGWRKLGRQTETIGAEHRILKGLLWYQYWNYKDRHTPLHAGDNVTDILSNQPAGVESRVEAERLHEFERKIAPLHLFITDQVEKRINFIIPTIDPDYIFGGYITKFNLALHLSEAGYRVRIVIVDYCNFQPVLWKQKFKAFQGLEHLLEKVAIVYAFNREKPLAVNPEDVFIATTWWTAQIAHQAVKDLNKEKFIYLIQEYEPYTFPMGSHAALAEQTYQFPHFALFSTRFLRDFFALNRIGVYAQNVADGDKNCLDFRNTITRVDPVRLEQLQDRSTRKLLFYARPEPHAARNMYDIGLLALKYAVCEGVFDDRWEFYGIGTVNVGCRIRLAKDKSLYLIPRQSQEEYARTLCHYDMGLGLMFTPHPSLVPIEMASAGMVVVTNSFQNKTQAAMRAISSNILVRQPTINDISAGLTEAVCQVEDLKGRVSGSQVDWPTQWNVTFDQEFMEKMKEFIHSIITR